MLIPTIRKQLAQFPDIAEVMPAGPKRRKLAVVHLQSFVYVRKHPPAPFTSELLLPIIFTLIPKRLSPSPYDNLS